MGVTVRELVGKLGLEVDEASFEVADKLFEISKHGLVAVGAAAAAFGLAIAESVHHVAEQADALDKMSQRTGVGTDALQELGYAGKLAGVSMESLEMGLKFMAKSGIKDVQGELFKLADQMQKLPEEGGSRAAFAIKHLGKMGTALIPLLNRGGDALAEFAREAEEAGAVMSQDTIRAGVELKDNLERLQFSLGGLVKTIAGPLLEPTAELVLHMRDWVNQNRKWMATGIQSAVRVLGVGLKAVWAVLSAVGSVLKYVIKNWKLFAVIIGSAAVAALVAMQGEIASTLLWFGALSAAATFNALKVAGAWVIANWPFVAMGIAIAALILLIEDIWVALHGGESAIGVLGGKWTEFTDKLTKEDPDDWGITKGFKGLFRWLLDINGETDRLIRKLNGSALAEWIKNSRLNQWLESQASEGRARAKVGGLTDYEKANGMFGYGASPDMTVAAKWSGPLNAESGTPLRNSYVTLPAMNVTINGGDKNTINELDTWWKQQLRANYVAVDGGG